MTDQWWPRTAESSRPVPRLGAAVVAGSLLVGLGGDAALNLVFAPAVKACVSSGMVTGLLGGALCGMTVTWFRGARRPDRT